MRRGAFVVLGLMFVALGARLPPTVTQLFKAIVGVVLVVLGIRMLAGPWTSPSHATTTAIASTPTYDSEHFI